MEKSETLENFLRQKLITPEQYQQIGNWIELKKTIMIVSYFPDDRRSWLEACANKIADLNDSVLILYQTAPLRNFKNDKIFCQDASMLLPYSIITAFNVPYTRLILECPYIGKKSIYRILTDFFAYQGSIVALLGESPQQGMHLLSAAISHAVIVHDWIVQALIQRLIWVKIDHSVTLYEF